MRWLAPLAVLALLAGCVAPASDRADAPTATQPNGPGGATTAQLFLPPLLHAPGAAVSNGAEPSILADRNGQFVWIGDTTGVYYSTDNGTTFHTVATYLGSFGLEFGDGVALAQDESGHLYGGFLHDNRIDVARSDDGTRFGSVAYAAGVSGSADRPWLAAHGSDVVLFYFDAPLVAAGLWEHCTRSTDGGATFLGDRMPVSVQPGQGGKAFYDGQGRFYFAGDAGKLYRYSTCLGGGLPIDMVNPDGVNNMLQGDAQGTDLYMAASTNGGAAITLAGRHESGTPKLLKVSPPELKANTYATVSAWGDEVAVAWYGSTTPGDPSQSGYSGDFNVYLAVVRGFWGNATVSHYRLTEKPNHHGTICMTGLLCTGSRGLLDYFMVDYDKWGGLHVAYADDTGGGSVRYLHVPPLNATSTGVPGGPVARFSARIDGTTIHADGSASTPATGLAYAWDWGDGAHATGAVAQHNYTDLGAYQVKLTVTDAKGRSGTYAQGVLIDGSQSTIGAPPPSTATSAPAPTGTGSKAPGKGSSSAPGTTTKKKTGALELAPVAVALLAIALRRRPD